MVVDTTARVLYFNENVAKRATKLLECNEVANMYSYYSNM